MKKSSICPPRPRETAILRLPASGMTSDAIAQLLSFSQKTIRDHQYAIKSPKPTFLPTKTRKRSASYSYLEAQRMKQIGLSVSIILFGIPALFLWFATSIAVPALTDRGWEPLLAWFFAGMLIFAPLLVAALVGALLAAPAPSLAAILEHLRVCRLSASDWRLAVSTLVLTIGVMALLRLAIATVWPHLVLHPPFMSVEPLGPGRYYILALWLPFFAFNIIGEELWWRGFIQPRQEPVFGHATWIIQGLLHGAFHFSFGLGILLTLLPVLFSIPWAVYRSRNTSVGIVIHAGVNGPGFLAVSFGFVSA